MIQKLDLVENIEKYYLGGIVESVKWSCPYKTGHSAFTTSRINSLGDFSLNPLWG